MGIFLFFTDNAGTSAERMRIISDGNVGIGTTAPAKPLDVYAAGTAQARVNAGNGWADLILKSYSAAGGGGSIYFENSSGTYAAQIFAYQNYSSPYLSIYTNNAERMRIISDGNVGIGTTAPAAKLDVTGDAIFRHNSDSPAGYAAGTDLAVFGSHNGTGTLFEVFTQGDVSRFKILGSGATTVNGALTGTSATFSDDITLTGTRAIKNSTSAGVLTLQGGASWPGGKIVLSGGNAPSTGDIKFYTGLSTGTPAQRLVITNDGNVGIGTASPSNVLDVQGGTTNTAIVARSTDAKAQISLVDNSTTSVGSVVIGAEGDDLFLTAGSGGSEALRIKSDGNVGIGTTAPTSLLHVAGDLGNGNFLSHINNTGTQSEDNGLKVQIASTGSGAHGLKVQTGGASNAFIVAGDGNVGVGLSASSMVQKFNVNGTAYINGSVGIGTTAPSSLLHISSTSPAFYIQDSDATSTHSITSMSGGTNFTVDTRQSDGTFVSTDYQIVKDASGANYQRWFTQGTERMRIASDGVVTTNKLEPINGDDSGYLGSSSKKWKQVYFGILEADTAKISGLTNLNGMQYFVTMDSSGNLRKDSRTFLNSTGGTLTGALTGTSATFSSAVTANAGINIDNINIDGTTIALSSGNLTLDVAGDIILDADSGAWRFKDNGGSIIELSVGAGSSPTFYSPVSNADIVFKGNDSGSAITALTLDMSDAGTAIFNHDIKLSDNGKALFGAGDDLQIYHNGSNSYIQDVGAGILAIDTNGTDVRITKTDSEFMAKFIVDGAVELYHNNALKLATTSTGTETTGLGSITNTAAGVQTALKLSNNTAGASNRVAVDFYTASTKYGTIEAGYGAASPEMNFKVGNPTAQILKLNSTGIDITGNATFADNGKAIFGGGNDLQIYHAGGTNGSYIDNYVGPMRFNNYGNDTDIIFQNDNGSGGIAEYFRLYGSLASAGGTRYTTWPDNSRVTFGTSQDLQIYHDGTDSFITNSTGYLAIKNEVTNGYTYLHGDTVHLRTYTGNEPLLTAVKDGAVSLYYDNAVKLATTSTGVTVTGALKTTTILDTNNSAGTNGQVLTTTGSALDWKTLAEISGVDGTGTVNYIPKWTDSDTIGNSTISDNGSTVTVASDFHVYKVGSDKKLWLSEGTSGNGLTNVQLNSNGVSYLKGGSVGIGTTAPGARLHLYGTGVANTPTLAIDNTTAGTYIHSVESFSPNMTSGQTNLIVVGRAGSTKNSGYIGYKYSSAGSDDNLLSLGHWGSNHLVNIKGDGNVGIGNVLPECLLDLRKSIDGPLRINLHNTSTNAAADATISFETNGQIDWGLGIDRTDGYFKVGRHNTLGTNTIIQVNGSGTISAPTIHIDGADGKVGIGTTTPEARLHVSQSSNAAVRLTRTSTDGQVLWFYRGSTASGNVIVKSTGMGLGGGTGENNIFIKTDGNVGIGTTAPSGKLHVCCKIIKNS